VIGQLTGPVQFINASRVLVPLKAPSAGGSILALGVVMTSRAPALRVSDNLGEPRWRQANSDGRTALWHRLHSPHAGVLEVVIETPNALEITGHALLAETAGLNAGAAVQLLSDLLLESSLGTGRANY
jgi:hypothetical protein